MNDQHKVSQKPLATVSSYTTGFTLSLLLTIIAFGVVVFELLNGTVLVAVLVVCAIAQLFVQLHFFLHLGRETNPRWNMMIFLFMLIIVLILVVGTLWIMKNLDYHILPSEMDAYMRGQINKGF